MTTTITTKYEAPFALFCLLNVVAPYFTGPVMMANEKRMEKWGWFPKEADGADDDKIRMAHDKLNPDELHFL